MRSVEGDYRIAEFFPVEEILVTGIARTEYFGGVTRFTVCELTESSNGKPLCTPTGKLLIPDHRILPFGRAIMAAGCVPLHDVGIASLKVS